MNITLPIVCFLIVMMLFALTIMAIILCMTIKKYNTINQRCEEYKDIVDSTSKIKAENESLKRIINRNKEYNETVLEQVGDMITSHPNWGFGNDCPFPGSTVVQIDPVVVDEENFVVVKMKTEFEPVMAERILNEPDPRRRYSIALRSLQLQGVIDRISRSLINTCAIQYSLASDKDADGNTRVSIYYQIAAKQYDDSTMIDLSKAGDIAAES